MEILSQWGVRSHKFSESVRRKIVDYNITPEMYQEALDTFDILGGVCFIYFDVDDVVLEFWMYEGELAKANSIEAITHKGYDHEEGLMDVTLEYTIRDYSRKEQIAMFDDYLHIAQ